MTIDTTAMLPRYRAAALAFFLVAAACSGGDPEAGAEAPAADIILRNGRIITVSTQPETASALAVADGRIIALGGDADVDPLQSGDTEVIDLEGRTVVPGLIDSHIHALGYGLHISQHVMFSTGERLSVADMLEKIEARAKESQPGQWIYVRGPYSLDFVEEGRLPNRRELDAITPDNPVFINMQGHVGVVNSAAIRLSGVTADTPDPANGIMVRDPATGELEGTLYEFPAFTPFLRSYPPHSFDERVEAARQANDVFARLGITTVVNLWAEPENLAVLRHLEERDELPVRWSMVYRLAPERFAGKSQDEIEAILRDFDLPQDNDRGKITVNGVKIIYDGFAEAAWMHDEYLEDMFGEGWHGVAFWDPATLRAVMEVCAERDIQVFVHVAGDRALDDVLDAMAAIDERYPLAGRRWTLEHASTEPTEDNLRQVRDMELIVSTQQAMGWSIGKTFKKYWGEERGATFAPNRTWLEALGHPYVKAGSDNRPIDPFIGFWSFIAREDVDGRVGRPDQVLGREDVLRMYTANGAYGIFTEDWRGSIDVGMDADLVVLSDDIMRVPVADIPAIKPVVTIVAGDIEFRDGL